MPGSDQMTVQSNAGRFLSEVFDTLPQRDYADHALPRPDYADLERRVADIEDRLRREDQERAAKQRLRELGLVFPGEREPCLSR